MKSYVGSYPDAVFRRKRCLKIYLYNVCEYTEKQDLSYQEVRDEFQRATKYVSKDPRTDRYLCSSYSGLKISSLIINLHSNARLGHIPIEPNADISR